MEEKDELIKTSATTDDLIHIIGKQVVQIADLETEVLILRQKLGVQSDRDETAQDVPDQNLPLINNSNHLSTAPQAYEQLSHKHAELIARHERLEALFTLRERRYREAKDVIKQWKAYINRKFPSPNRSRDPSRPPDLGRGSELEMVSERHEDSEVNVQGASSPLKLRHNADDDAEDAALPAYPDGLESATIQESSAKISKKIRESKQVTSSQTTESLDEFEDTPRATTKGHPSSDDAPVVVSARQLKRKASPSFPSRYSRRIKQEPTSPGGGIELDSESYGDLRSPHTLHHQETSDLNAIGLPLETPRKPRLDLHLERRVASEDVTRPRPNPLDQVSSSDGKRHSRNQKSGKKGTASIRDDKRSIGQDVMASSDHSVTSAGQSGTPSKPILQQRSVNLPAPHPAVRRASKASTRLHGPKDNAMSDGMHGGAHDARRQLENVKRSPEIEIKTEEPAAARLDALLAGRTPPPKISLAGETRPSGRKDRWKHVAHMEPTPKPADKGRGNPADRPQARTREDAPRASPPPTTTREEPPLRSRPLSALQLEDFKINPAYLGTDFAYKDAVRGRDQRRGLGVCDRPECCGETFRRVVEVGGTSVSGRSDEAALAEYLGSTDEAEARATWARGGPAERRALLVEAHVHSFARQHGRHRHAFARRLTPPGFWRTDMPTTQEEAEDRVRARQRERQMVEERWREARRGSGARWMFRDE